MRSRLLAAAVLLSLGLVFGAGAQKFGPAIYQSLSVGHLVNNTGFQTVSVSGCAFTAGAVGNNCANNITLPVTEPDTAYLVNCAAYNTNDIIVLSEISNQTTTSFTVLSVAMQTTGTGAGTIQCNITHS